MTIISVDSSAQLKAALAQAGAGDTIRLTPGNYGDVSIQGMDFGSGITIQSADPAHPAVLNTLTMVDSAGIQVSGVTIDMAASLTEGPSTSAVLLRDTSNISFHSDIVKAELPITGVAQTASAPDSTGNVLGLGTGRGFTIMNSSHVTVDHSDISQVFHGIALSSDNYISITNNTIHDVRTSPIAGAQLNHIVIDGNTLSDSHPWHWGSGDHADFIHLWTDSHQTTVSTDIQITNNTMAQGGGTGILGVLLQDSSGLGFTDVKVANNLIITGTGTGIRAGHLMNSAITDNALLQSSGAAHNAPGIYITGAAQNLDVGGNLTGAITSVTGPTINLHDNHIIQDADPNLASYYDPTLIADTSGLSPSAAYDLVVSRVDFGMRIVASASGGNQIVAGGGGSDTLVGGAGNDTLTGGVGSDQLTGSGGNDRLIGGIGADTFVFTKTTGGGGADLIVDFNPAQDRIDLHAIDAISGTKADDPFVFIGSQAFSHTAGELRYSSDGHDSTVQGDVNGDGVADFMLKLLGDTHVIAHDFQL